MPVLSIALAFFLVTNPIGNTPTFLALVKDFSPERQRRILFRESFFSAMLAFFFLFLGELFLDLLQVKDYTVSICGGILLSIVAINMIFPHHETSSVSSLKTEPFIVPIATPLLSGAGLMTTILLYSRQEGDYLKILIAILISSVGVTLVLVTAPYLNRLFGRRGLLALEQLMGMVLAMLSMQMLVQGTDLFVRAVK